MARGGVTRDSDMNKKARELLATLGHPEIRPTREVGSLSAAGKQIVSMARALSHDARVIVMDEPSAVLDPDEVDGLFKVVDDLRASGAAIIYISHRLEEIRRIGDRLTVLKDGKTVATDLSAKDTPTADLITLMTGRRSRRCSRVGRPSSPTPLRCCRSPASDATASSTTSRSTYVPARSSASPVSSARGAARSSRRLRCTPRHPRHRHGRRQEAAQRIGRLRRHCRARAVPRGAQVAGPDPRRRGLPQHLARQPRPVRPLRHLQGRRRASCRARGRQVGRRTPRRPRTRSSARSRAATSRRSSWPAGCCGRARCCCSTSRLEASTSEPAPRSTT